MPKQTIMGKGYRFQINAEDYSEKFDEEWGVKLHCAELIGKRKSLVRFTVYALKNYQSKSASFTRAGAKLYDGHSLEEALKRINPHVNGNVLLSKAFDRFKEPQWSTWMMHVMSTINADPTLRFYSS